MRTSWSREGRRQRPVHSRSVGPLLRGRPLPSQTGWRPSYAGPAAADHFGAQRVVALPPGRTTGRQHHARPDRRRVPRQRPRRLRSRKPRGTLDPRARRALRRRSGGLRIAPRRGVGPAPAGPPCPRGRAGTDHSRAPGRSTMPRSLPATELARRGVTPRPVPDLERPGGHRRIDRGASACAPAPRGRARPLSTDDLTVSTSRCRTVRAVRRSA